MTRQTRCGACGGAMAAVLDPEGDLLTACILCGREQPHAETLAARLARMEADRALAAAIRAEPKHVGWPPGLTHAEARARRQRVTA